MFVGVMFYLAFTLKNSEDLGSMFSPMLVLDVWSWSVGVNSWSLVDAEDFI
jgi:hypothetical protein